ncbi:MAG: heavy metal sensor histidine kinase [Bacillota bacterium]
MILRSLSFRVTLYSCLLTYGLLLGCWGLIYLTVDRELYNKDQATISDRLETIRDLFNQEPNHPTRLIHRVEEEWPRKSYERIYVRVTDENGMLVTETPSLKVKYAQIWDSFPDNIKDAGRVNPLVRTTIEDHIFDMGSFHVPLKTSRGLESALVQIALERTSEEGVLKTLRHALVYILAFGFLASLLSARLTVKKVVGSIRKIATTAQTVSSGDIKERIDPAMLPIEFADFAKTLNNMLDRLEESFERLSRFSADMAHELRTPLNNLRGSLEVGLAKERSVEEYESLLESSVEECGRLKPIIDSLLFIARSQQPAQEIHKQQIDLSLELENIISFYQASADDRRLMIELQIKGDLTIMAEKTLLQRAVGNLLSNAIRLAPEGSRIYVRAQKELGFMVISVTDEGPGISAKDLPFIGERFFRVEESRAQSTGGNGLGLSIVKSIAMVHGGKMEVKSQVGKGSTFYLFLPEKD